MTGKSCPQDLLYDPLKGNLRIDLETPERVWLVQPDGTKKMILWPTGFRLVTEPIPHVLAPGGMSWFDGSPIVFESVNRQTAIGTAEEPFTVHGWIGGRYCYTTR